MARFTPTQQVAALSFVCTAKGSLRTRVIFENPGVENLRCLHVAVKNEFGVTSQIELSNRSNKVRFTIPDYAENVATAKQARKDISKVKAERVSRKARADIEA